MGTPDKIRAKNYRDRKKQREAEAKVEAINACGTREAWYEKNRRELAELDPEELKQLQARHEQVLAALDWMEDGYLLDPSDECFVSIADGIDILVDDLSKGGCPHLGYILKDSDIPSDWSSGVWSGKKSWHDSNLLQQLESEGHATATYVRYGCLTNPPDWLIVQFLQKHGYTFDQAAAVVGYYVPETGNRGTTGPVVYK